MLPHESHRREHVLGPVLGGPVLKRPDDGISDDGRKVGQLALEPFEAERAEGCRKDLGGHEPVREVLLDLRIEVEVGLLPEVA
jgi:hypothetical protein